MRKPIVCILVLILTVCVIYSMPVRSSHESATDSLLRFHVIANSDSPEDQKLKLQVRDRIVSVIGDQVSSISNKQQLIDYLNTNMELIEDIAREEIQKSQRDYGALPEMGSFQFPTKSYGNLVLPAGEYEALRVVLGEGKGANWWCVMFPPLCFVDTKNSVAYAKDQQAIEDVLTEREYESQVTMDDIERVPVRARFKVLELIRGSRVRMADN